MNGNSSTVKKATTNELQADLSQLNQLSNKTGDSPPMKLKRPKKTEVISVLKGVMSGSDELNSVETEIVKEMPPEMLKIMAT